MSALHIVSLSETVASVATFGWYALATLSRHERVVAQELKNRGIDVFLPTITETHRWSDRRKKMEVPLFPGYIFVRALMSAMLRRSAICARGVLGFVTMHGEPLPVPDRELDDIKRLLASQFPCATHPFLKIGQRVRVRGGALDGIEGHLVRFDGGCKLVVSVEAISRSVALHIDGYDFDVI
jgi:transcription termination/antitermination protein NusG